MNESKLPWFQNRERKPFNQYILLNKKEELITTKRDKFTPQQINDLFDLWAKMKARPRKIPGILSCMDPPPSNYKENFRKVLDPYYVERKNWEQQQDKLTKAVDQLRKSPWDTPSHEGMWKRDREIRETELILNGLKTKLDGLPPQNTFEPQELYLAPTDAELQEAGLITLDRPYPRFTEKGLELYREMERGKRDSISKLTGRFPIDNEAELKEFAMGIWSRIKNVYLR